MNYLKLTDAFEAHEIDAASFHHGEHVAVAYQMLQKYKFSEAAYRYGENINTLAIKAGAPEKFNSTITYAFMSLVMEQMETTEHKGYEDFLSQNRDLLSKNLLSRWYSSNRLGSDLARKMFLLPDKTN
jgi:hypothetical protein